MRLSTLYNQIDLISKGYFKEVYFMFYLIFGIFIVIIIFGYFIQKYQIEKSKHKIIKHIINERNVSFKRKLTLSLSGLKESEYSENLNNGKDKNSYLDSLSNKFSEIMEDDEELKKNESDEENQNYNDDTLDEKFL